ncbi:thiamine phosphate synthase [Bacillus sp. DTU_2020_1000418_1_SI_GHA_SEK_038]|uniref:thiamine phosphate synthase n=1 Tax=Bacillus sp. DTU_2020_1000418_1_SI_GHA_SEK_038 TaxID=3077585 RepID=UPI0028EAA085|nr:thiamine phosphate synthase [Bacillus sp. DTU_2020_1000418_1_SI_GHA_SEK_038]WNS77539.1 thiamine phosphate synthase [Bacillus sp. DTU_2020_1000418_1_SI_GHA_SEK_038]
MAVTNDRLKVDHLTKIMINIDPFVDYFIIRERTKTANDYIELIAALTEEKVSKDKLIVNDRVDVALVSNIQRVQLPGHGLAVSQVKDHFPQLLAGRSVHSAIEAEHASYAGADWLLYGHVFETNCKSGLEPRGLSELQEISKKVMVDLYAIGGIKPEHIDMLHHIGVNGIAVMSTIFESDDPVSAAKEYYEACQQAICLSKG